MFLGLNFNFVEYWAKKIKENPDKFRPILNRFINAQILHAQRQLRKLPTEKLIELFQIKNLQLIAKFDEER
jgi:hypothetical protein